MEIRLHETPTFIYVDALSGVGTLNDSGWFICTLEGSSLKTGKDYPGYYALWRFKKTYPTKEEAIAACRRWLGRELVEGS